MYPCTEEAGSTEEEHESKPPGDMDEEADEDNASAEVDDHQPDVIPPVSQCLCQSRL